VAHKEKLKQLKKTVDVLSLSLPRYEDALTCAFGDVGHEVIETAPEGRALETFVMRGKKHGKTGSGSRA